MKRFSADMTSDEASLKDFLDQLQGNFKSSQSRDWFAEGLQSGAWGVDSDRRLTRLALSNSGLTGE